MPKDRDVLCYELLMQVFRDNAYASIALNAALPTCSPQDKPYITKLFYGVLERNVYYEYVLAYFAKEKPKKPIAVLIKMGYYLLENMRLPAYAAVDNMVRLSKKVGKGGASSFINSALRHFAPPPMPREGTAQFLSVQHSKPLWLCEQLIKDYGYDFACDLLAYQPDHSTHIRVNIAEISREQFAEKYKQYLQSGSLQPTKFGYVASHECLEKIDGAHYAVQSAASIAAASTYLYGLDDVHEILDLCAAPGGKSAYMASVTRAHIMSCDIHPHRVELIKKYAMHCHADITAVQNDATVFNPTWENKFDVVVCDVPCSGLGVIGSKPDILYHRSESDIDALADLQTKILQTASRYVRSGGRLCYSTCTVLKQENGDIIDTFLQNNCDFVCQTFKSPFSESKMQEMQLYPHIHHTDGFYVAVMRKL